MKKEQKSLAFEMILRYRTKFRISLALNALLALIILALIIF